VTLVSSTGTGRLALPDGVGEALTEQLAEELDRMKGMAMKVGQILSYFDGVLPAPVHRALTGLQQGALAVPFADMSRVAQEVFGTPLEALFDSFDQTPIASASIGQVYRARWRGTDVAVKIQYPDVRSSIDADFSRLTALSRLAALGSAVDGPGIVAELRDTFVAECDYILEARNQNTFAAALRGEPGIIVPEAIPVCVPEILRHFFRKLCGWLSFPEGRGRVRQQRCAWS
jgi:predicted unusual protein kinase regulating ubiquinone biosynthesis (AarF/ABC1/UbiB family)